MNQVAASEFNLLTIARALVGQGHVDDVRLLIRQKNTLKDQIGSTAMSLLKESLAKGMILKLSQIGWIKQTHINNGKKQKGRWWSRWSPQELIFSEHSFLTLKWLTVNPLGIEAKSEKLKGKARTLGDELVLYFACDLLRHSGCKKIVANSPAFLQSPLCWLAYPDVLCEKKALDKTIIDQSSFNQLIKNSPFILEVLQQHLVERWCEIEQTKKTIESPQSMINLGVSQSSVLSALHQAAIEGKKQDLLAFVYIACSDILRFRPEHSQWIVSLSRSGTLSEYTSACRNAAALLQSVITHNDVITHAQSAHFIDDDYDNSQLVLKFWEHLGNEQYEYARSIVQKLTALDIGLDNASPA